MIGRRYTAGAIPRLSPISFRGTGPARGPVPSTDAGHSVPPPCGEGWEGVLPRSAFGQAHGEPAGHHTSVQADRPQAAEEAGVLDLAAAVHDHLEAAFPGDAGR